MSLATLSYVRVSVVVITQSGEVEELFHNETAKANFDAYKITKQGDISSLLGLWLIFMADNIFNQFSYHTGNDIFMLSTALVSGDKAWRSVKVALRYLGTCSLMFSLILYST